MKYYSDMKWCFWRTFNDSRMNAVDGMLSEKKLVSGKISVHVWLCVCMGLVQILRGFSKILTAVFFRWHNDVSDLPQWTCITGKLPSLFFPFTLASALYQTCIMWPARSVPRCKLKKIENRDSDICRLVFVARPFTRAPVWKQPKCPSADEMEE